MITNVFVTDPTLIAVYAVPGCSLIDWRPLNHQKIIQTPPRTLFSHQLYITLDFCFAVVSLCHFCFYIFYMLLFTPLMSMTITLMNWNSSTSKSLNTVASVYHLIYNPDAFWQTSLHQSTTKLLLFNKN